MVTKVIVFSAILLATSGLAHDQRTALECEEIKQKIRHIQAKMRAGYTRAQGERMEAELRKLRALRSKACH